MRTVFLQANVWNIFHIQKQ